MTRLTFGVVAFLDILGFSAMVASDARSPTTEHLPRLLEVLETVRGAIDPSVYDVRAFSDSIVISAPHAPENVVSLVETVALLQRLCVARGTLVRGGVALGKHYADPHVIYSEALVTAYRTESTLARVPRIIVDANTLDYFWHSAACTLEQKQRMERSLMQDRDGHVFVHYATDAWIAEHARCVQEMMSGLDLRATTLLEKYQWLVAYNNAVAATSAPEHQISTMALGFARVAVPA